MRKRSAVLTLGVTLLFGVAACTSSGSGGGGASEGASGSTVPAAGAVTQAQCAKLNSPSTVSWNGPTKPVTPPSGSKLVVITTTSLGLEAAARPVDGIKAAVAELGWKSLVLDGKGTPSLYSENILKAVNLKAAAIITVGIDPALVSNALSKARAAGIVLVSASETGDSTVNPTPPSTGFDADVSVSSQQMGTLLGQSIVCSTDHKANLLAYNDLEYASTKAFVDSAVDVVKACSTCTVSSEQNTTGAQVSTDLPGQTTTYLRTHPDVNAILSPYDPAAAFQIPAIESAKLAGNIKLFSTYGDLQNLSFIRSGKVQFADIGVPQEWTGWAAVDEMLRVMAKQPLVNENLPLVLITKSQNLPPAGTAFTGSAAGYESQFEKLWGLS